MQSTYPHNPKREERTKQRKKREYGCYYAYYCDRYPACQGGPFPIIKVDHTGLSKTNHRGSLISPGGPDRAARHIRALHKACRLLQHDVSTTAVKRVRMVMPTLRSPLFPPD